VLLEPLCCDEPQPLTAAIDSAAAINVIIETLLSCFTCGPVC
jgi:hypothetical protein